METASAAGIAAAVVNAVLADLAQAMPRALDEIAGALPRRFPSRVLDPLARGVRRRLQRIQTRAD
jgi:hypothetical protein